MDDRLRTAFADAVSRAIGAEMDQLRQRAETAEAERDRHAAAIERVRWLREDPRRLRYPFGGPGCVLGEVCAAIDAVLAGTDTPEASRG